MKKLLIALLASSGLAIAAPVFADSGYYDDYSGAPASSAFNQEYQVILDRIQYGINNDLYTDQQARQYYRELRTIQAQDQLQASRGYYDPDDIQAQLVNLDERLSVANEQGRELNGYWYGGGRYIDRGYY